MSISSPDINNKINVIESKLKNIIERKKTNTNTKMVIQNYVYVVLFLVIFMILWISGLNITCNTINKSVINESTGLYEITNDVVYERSLYKTFIWTIIFFIFSLVCFYVYSCG